LIATRRAFMEEARSWIGVPFEHAGRTRAGIDCAGMLVVVCRSLGIACSDRVGYSRHSAGKMLPEALAEFADRIPIESAGLGDVLTFWRSRPGREEHLALFEPPGTLVQSWIRGGVNAVSLDGRWRERLVAAYHVRGVSA
jgi:hypothetical protein